jgi:hypothetical protein
MVKKTDVQAALEFIQEVKSKGPESEDDASQ